MTLAFLLWALTGAMGKRVQSLQCPHLCGVNGQNMPETKGPMQSELKGFQKGTWLSPPTIQVTSLGPGEEMTSRGHTDLGERGLGERDDLRRKIHPASIAFSRSCLLNTLSLKHL